MSSNILFDVGIVFIESGDDFALELASLEPFAEIDKIVHDILTIFINMT